MKLSLDYNTGKFTINSYDQGSVTINGDRYTGNLIITPDQLFEEWSIEHVSQLQHDHFEMILERPPEILLLGTGSSLNFPPARLIAGLSRQGIGMEVMDTGSACRTFNVLAAEDRHVAAALILD